MSATPVLDLSSLRLLWPWLGLLGLSMATLLVEAFGKERLRRFNVWLAVAGVFALLGAFWIETFAAPGIVARSLSVDPFSRFASMIILIALLFSLLQLTHSEDVLCGEVVTLSLLSAFGACMMAASRDLFTALISLEIMSVPAYALAGSRRTDLRSNEAAMKYFLLGAFASAIMIYGIALVFFASGTLYFDQLARILPELGESTLLPLVGVGMILIGFAFKVSLAPFHMWAPDVYEGAPTSITSFMATGVKAGAFAAFLRVFLTAFPSFSIEWGAVLTVLSVLSMTIGNLIAYAQRSVKRMLAYSSIAHAGVMVMAIASSQEGQSAAAAHVLFYLFSYAFMTAGAFAIVTVLERQDDDADEVRFHRLAYHRPFLAAAMAIFLLSLAGIPPLAGFLAKFYIFQGVMRSGNTILAIAGILNSLLALGYYIRPILWMYLAEDTASSSRTGRSIRALPIGVAICIFLSAGGTVLLGIMPETLTRAAVSASEAIPQRPGNLAPSAAGKSPVLSTLAQKTP